MNRGTGAGGANTNYYGKLFEGETNNAMRLLELEYILVYTKIKNIWSEYYLYKVYKDRTITFIFSNKFKKYMKNKYNINVFRLPDEAYIIEYNTSRKIIKILEKKEQCVNGSVETKLWASPSLKREYELILNNKFELYYGLCVNEFLKEKLISNKEKYIILNIILKENNINILFGDDKDYFQTLNKWLNSSL